MLKAHRNKHKWVPTGQIWDKMSIKIMILANYKSLNKNRNPGIHVDNTK